jgi:hypothetical protein
VRERCGSGTLPGGFRLSPVQRQEMQHVLPARSAVLAMFALPPPEQPALVDAVRAQRAAVEDLAAGDVSAEPKQDQAVGVGIDASSWRELSGSLADQAQADAGHARTGSGADARGRGAGGRCLPGPGQGRPGGAEQAPFRRRRGDHVVVKFYFSRHRDRGFQAAAFS